MKKVIVAALAAITLVGAVAPASAMNWNDFWYCSGATFDDTRTEYCRAVNWGW